MGIALLIALILSIRIKLHIIYEDELRVYLSILFYKIPIIPDTDAKFTPEKLKKYEKYSPIHLLASIDKSQSQSQSTSEPSVLDRLNSIKEILLIFLNSFRHHLHVRLARIHINVATSDAAQTAILYGAVAASVACIVDIIDDITNLKRLKKSSIIVEPDFLSDKTDIKLKIVLHITIFGAIKTIMKSFIEYYSLKNITTLPKGK